MIDPSAQRLNRAGAAAVPPPAKHVPPAPPILQERTGTMLKTLARTDVALPEPDPGWSIEIHQRSGGVELHVEGEGPKAEVGHQLAELGLRLQREAREGR